MRRLPTVPSSGIPVAVPFGWLDTAPISPTARRSAGLRAGTLLLFRSCLFFQHHAEENR